MNIVVPVNADNVFKEEFTRNVQRNVNEILFVCISAKAAAPEIVRLVKKSVLGDVIIVNVVKPAETYVFLARNHVNGIVHITSVLNCVVTCVIVLGVMNRVIE